MGKMIQLLSRLALAFWLAQATAAASEPSPSTLRLVAANLTSDRYQRYSPDNGNHSNPEGAGARILKALRPDIVLIQEFGTNVPVRQWLNATLGEDFHFYREADRQIPNGIISRFPIAASGSWDDPVLDNRDFAWARLRLPGGEDLWAVSVHFHSRNATSRETQARALLGHLEKNVPARALLVVGGDFNTRQWQEPCFKVLGKRVILPARKPDDGHGNDNTNHPRNRPYDTILLCPALQKRSVPVEIAGKSFPHGLVFDSRVFTPLAALAPVQAGDSGLPFMQHMAVIRDVRLPPSR